MNIKIYALNEFFYKKIQSLKIILAAPFICFCWMFVIFFCITLMSLVAVGKFQSLPDAFNIFLSIAQNNMFYSVFYYTLYLIFFVIVLEIVHLCVFSYGLKLFICENPYKFETLTEAEVMFRKNMDNFLKEKELKKEEIILNAEKKKFKKFLAKNCFSKKKN